MLVLDDQYEGVFQPFKASYLKTEIEVLTEQTRKKIESVLNFPINQFDEGKLDVAGKGDFYLKWKRSKPSVPDLKRWAESVLNADCIDSLMILYSIAIQRCEKLSESGKLGNNVYKIFETLISHLCLSFLNVVMDTGLELLPEADPKAEPDLFFFNIVKGVSTAFQKVELHLQEEVFPHLSGSLTSQKQCLNIKSDLLAVIERQIVSGLNRCLEATVKYVSKILIRDQKKTDFKPREDGPLPDATSATPVCTAITKIIKSIADTAFTYLDGKNVDSFLSVLGKKLYEYAF
jgi:hypothetical protein